MLQPAGGPGKAKPGGAGKRRKPAVPKEPAVPREPAVPKEQIGRASCRERV